MPWWCRVIRLVAEWSAAGAAAVVASVLLWLLLAAYAALGGALAWVDARTHRLPNRLVAALALTTLSALLAGCLLAGQPDRAGRAALAGLATGALFLALHLAAPSGLGFGDVKLAPILGALAGSLSWGHALLAAVLALFIGGLHAAVVLLATRNRRAHIAFGPALLLGTAVVLCL